MTLIEMVGTVGVKELKDSPHGFELYSNSANSYSPAREMHATGQIGARRGRIEIG